MTNFSQIEQILTSFVQELVLNEINEKNSLVKANNATAIRRKYAIQVSEVCSKAIFYDDADKQAEHSTD